MAAQTTTGLSNEVMTWYESKFLERAKMELIHREGFQKSTHKRGRGKTITFNRYIPLDPATTALTEGSNPTEADITSSTVSCTLAEYGKTVKVSKLLSLTSIDVDSGEKVALVGQNMGETLDTLARDALFSGATVQLAGGKSALSDIAASDKVSADELNKVDRTLYGNKAMKYNDGFWLGKFHHRVIYDLRKDSTWINAKTYSDVKDLYTGEVGQLHGITVLRTNNGKSENSTVTVYSNFIHGANAAGEYDLEKDTPKLYIKVPGPQDTSNPADRYSTISWAGSYVAKVLVASWVLNFKCAAS